MHGRWAITLVAEPTLGRGRSPALFFLGAEVESGLLLLAPEDLPMTLRDKYNHAIQTAKGFRMQGSADERDGKLHFHGTVNSQDEANKIWDAIKTVPDWRNDVVAQITVAGGAASGATATGTSGAAQTTYTVKAGDTLSKIAKEHLGDANAYMAIFEANKDQLKDPNLIKPGQVLKIPAAR
jgi:nucleoid-associated protein YgaU